MDRKKIIAAMVVCVILCGWTGCAQEDQAFVIPQDVYTDGNVLEKTACEPIEPLQTADEDVPRVLCVYVCGAVVNPGVYRLPDGSRAQDALEAAGGFGQNAAACGVNLAAFVSDGQQLFFPEEGEGALPDKTGYSADGRIDINTADEAALCTLPGIGTARAAAIIDYRMKNGSFRKTEDIMNVSGIKESAYEKIKELIMVR